MTRIITILIISLIMMPGCSGNKKRSASSISSAEVAMQDTVITIDIDKVYPQKELKLQDIMDIEYVPLESTDEYLCQGMVAAIGREVILVKNMINDGEVFIFDRNGKGLRKFNRKGQGPEEYMLYLSIFLDESNGEIYVDEVIRNILVYDLHGHFLRTIHRGGNRWINVNNYNSDYLIARESPTAYMNKRSDNQRFALLSKQDGNIIQDFRIHFKEKIEWGVTNQAGNIGGAPRLFPIVPCYNSWLVVEPSSDTIFRISPDYNLVPFIVRTPSIQSMKPATFLLPCIFTERYYFMEKITMKADLLRNEGFPKTHLAYDRIDNSLFEYTMLNDDFLNKAPVEFTVQEITNNEIAFWQKYEPYELIEAYKNGELRGKLKEIASGLEESSNPVIMVAKYKKHK